MSGPLKGPVGKRKVGPTITGASSSLPLQESILSQSPQVSLGVAMLAFHSTMPS